MSEDLLPEMTFDFARDPAANHVIDGEIVDDAIDLQLDSADARGIKRKETRVEKQLREQAEFWEAVFATDVGCTEIWNLLNMANPFEARFAAGPAGFPDSQATWYHLGQRDLSLRIYQTLERASREGVWHMRQKHDPRIAKPAKPKRLDSEVGAQ